MFDNIKLFTWPKAYNIMWSQYSNITCTICHGICYYHKMTLYHFCTILFTQIHKPKSHDLLTLCIIIVITWHDWIIINYIIQMFYIMMTSYILSLLYYSVYLMLYYLRMVSLSNTIFIPSIKLHDTMMHTKFGMDQFKWHLVTNS